MPDYTERLKLPLPRGNEIHNRSNHNALVQAIDQNAAAKADLDAHTDPGGADLHPASAISYTNTTMKAVNVQEAIDELQSTKAPAGISSTPITGVKTVTGVAAELFAGASRKTGRCRLVVRNMDPAVRVRIGPATVTDTTGFGVEPEAVVTLELNPAFDVPIYAVSEAGNVQVEVFEA